MVKGKFYQLLNLRLVNFFSLISFLFLIIDLQGYAQNTCELIKNQGQGYKTSIKSVTDDGGNNFTIELRVTHDGCTASCKSMARYSVEAIPGTYSNVSVTVVKGNLNYKNIDLGPNLAGDPFKGFRITGTSGFGNGAPGEFIIKYTLSGGLQNQRTQVKAGGDLLLVSFSFGDFTSILQCQNQNQNIYPYYAPPVGGKLTSLIGPELTSLYNFYSAGGTYNSNDIFQIFGNDVLIDVSVLTGMYSSTLNLLKSSYGLYDVIEDSSGKTIIGKIPILNLISLNSLTSYMKAVRPVYPPIPTAGLVTTLGDFAMHSTFVRNGFNLNGNTIKIGVISDSYNTIPGDPAQDDVLKGDLPGAGNPLNSIPVDVVKDYPFGSRSDEGRAMLQIIHDIAPKSELAFRTGYISATDFAIGIQELKAHGCNIIVDDITYISQPFLEDGVIAQAVDEVKSQGVTYFSAAGNYGNKSYQGYFKPGIAPSGISAIAHNYAPNGATDILQNISLEDGNYTIVMQWNDGSGFENTNTDLDIYLAGNTGNILFGFNRNNLGGQAIEVLPFTVANGGAQTNIMVTRASGSNPVFFKYIVFRGNLTFNEYGSGGSTLVGQANAEGAIAVGAVLYSNTPAYGVNPPTIASFSSVGGTPVNGTIRNKPELCAPNGVNTTVNLGGINIDGDQFPNFFGTSAAAPHAAAVAALVAEARSKFYDAATTPDELKTLLETTAIDMNTLGFDYSTGYGFLQADAALLKLANPSPQIKSLSYDTTKIPGLVPVTVSVSGNYLTPEAQIYFNGSPLTTPTQHIGDSVLVATIPEFSDLFPAIQAYNPPQAQTNGKDGGLSNPLYFSTKPKIVVKIDDKTKKFGEILPMFTANYSVVKIDGSTSLENSGLSESEIQRIKSIPFETIATATSNVGLWEIKPSSLDPLNTANGILPADSIDQSLLDRFDFVFENGFLTIEKMNLLVKAQDKTMTYGEELSGFGFDYLFNMDTLNLGTPVLITPGDKAEILTQLQQTHATALVNAVALVNAAALVNDLGEPLLDATALANKSFMISDATALANAAALVNGALIDPQALVDATAMVNAAALVNAVALVNAMALVNATALINSYDDNGNVTNSAALVNASALVNAAALVNSETINAASNSNALVILSENDIAILTGSLPGNISLRSINLITGKNVGKHLIVPGSLLSTNFNVLYLPGTLTINPAHAEITIDKQELSKIYDGKPATPAITVEPAGLEVKITYNGAPDAPVNVGKYQIVASVDDPNYTGSANETLEILPATATVRADDKIINKGSALPKFTASFSNFVNNEDKSVVTSLSFKLSPTYNGAAGIYQIIPSATAANYLFEAITGTLYVNPFGPGTKNVKTSLTCVEPIPMDENGYTYVANFAWENPNSSPVYVPVGADNQITGTGKFESSQQPILFMPGSGIWQARFNGEKITWALTTYNGTHKSSTASNASSTSNKCLKSAMITTSANSLSSINRDDLRVYPNPTNGKVFINIGTSILQKQQADIIDATGKIVRVVNNNLNVGNNLELDLSSLNKGLYFIRLYLNDKAHTIKVIKE